MPKPKDEVVAFPAYEIYGAGYNETEYTLYDWSKITTIAPFEPLGHKQPPGRAGHQPWPSPKETAENELYCTAHRHGVKVLQWSEASYNGTGCGAAEFYGWCRSVQSGKQSGNSTIFNSTAIRAWAEKTAVCIVAQGFDGIMLDMEGSYTVGRSDIRAAVTAGVCELKKQLRAVLPDGEIFWAVDTGNYFDYKQMTDDDCVDLWLDMDYCRCTPTNRGGNAALSNTAGIVADYKRYGVSPDKLGVIFPWFGCDFVCTDDSSCEKVVAKPKSERILPGFSNSGNSPHGGDGCGVGVDAGPGIAEVVMGLLPNKTGPVKLAPAPVYTKNVEWKNGTGGLHQTWFDDDETLEVKYKDAKVRGLKAVGMWTPDATWFNREIAKKMWDAVPTPQKRGEAPAVPV
jgi:hypothetical protein